MICQFSKTLFFVVLVVIQLVSCKTADAQVKKPASEMNSPKVNKPQKPKFGDFQNQDLNPGTLMIEASLIGDEEKTQLCGQDKSQIISLRILKIVQTGSSITQFPNTDEVVYCEMSNPEDQIQTLKERGAKPLTLLVKEKLCPNLADKYYQLMRIM